VYLCQLKRTKKKEQQKGFGLALRSVDPCCLLCFWVEGGGLNLVPSASSSSHSIQFQATEAIKIALPVVNFGLDG
jgi:hypothetical protein